MSLISYRIKELEEFKIGEEKRRQALIDRAIMELRALAPKINEIIDNINNKRDLSKTFIEQLKDELTEGV